MFKIESEVAPLKKVILSRPEDPLKRLIPEDCGRFLFDDILYPEVAQKEHDMFAGLLREHGAEVFYLEDLLTETLENDKARKWILDQIALNFDLTLSYFKGVYQLLWEMPSKQLCYHLRAGLTFKEAHTGVRGLIEYVAERDDFLLAPLPNHYFTRDPSCWIGNGVCINRMQYEVRRGESLNFATIYKFHPMFTQEKFEIWHDGTEKDRFPVEGGDVLVLSKDFVMIGCSERTNPQGIETLAHRLFMKNDVKRILLVQLPKARSCMHLDTVMTMLDEKSFCVAFSDFAPPAFTIQPGLKDGDLVISEEKNLLTGLERGLKRSDIRMICVGDSEDSIVQKREQWTDASNLLAVAPGVVVGYERNHKTNKRLRDEGYKILEIAGAELGRGRGGARCMSCPIERKGVN